MAPKTAPGKCRICGDSTDVLHLSEFNLNICASCYPRFMERRVRRASERYGMLHEGDHVAIALSGGKDSAALLFALQRLSMVVGFKTTCIHLHLDMGDYSRRSLQKVGELSGKAGVPLEVTYIANLGLRVQSIKGWHPCAVCGVIKRSLFNREASRLGATAVATAHTLEDVLLFTFKNMLSRRHYMPQPVLPPIDGSPRKIKPLMFTPERLNHVYCQLKGISYFDARCPQWSPRAHSLKGVFEHMEQVIPSSKLQLLLSMMQVLPAGNEGERKPLKQCPRCGDPTSQSLCALCRLADWFSPERHGGEKEIAQSLRVTDDLW